MGVLGQWESGAVDFDHNRFDRYDCAVFVRKNANASQAGGWQLEDVREP